MSCVGNTCGPGNQGRNGFSIDERVLTVLTVPSFQGIAARLMVTGWISRLGRSLFQASGFAITIYLAVSLDVAIARDGFAHASIQGSSQ